jgi:hypothetical protein
MKSRPYIGVIRIGPEYRTRAGYRARICRRHKAVSQDFYDADLGGQREAEAAAISWRKAMEAALPSPLGRHWRAYNEGKLGVVWREQCEIWDPRREQWYPRDNIMGFYPAPTGRLSISRSVARHGEAAAEREVKRWLRERRAEFSA